MKRSGFFELQSPRDLLEKAQHDLGRLRANPLDSYAAFDLFVAVRHLPDWLYPHDEDKRNSVFSNYVKFRIARHIADRGKHFVVSHPRHRQVVGTSTVSGAFDPRAFSPTAFSPKAFDMGSLIVELDPADPDTATIGRRIDALELAERIFAVASTIVA